MLLAGDIGGTKTILRLARAESFKEPLYDQTYPSQEYPDLVPMVKQFLQEACEKLDQKCEVDKACFAIAGPVVNNCSQLTNLSWFLETEQLQKELAIDSVKLINDFVAVGYGVTCLAPEEIYTLQEGKYHPESPIAVIGAGTGLGEGFIIPRGKEEYQVFASEGSHGDFAPRTGIEFELLNYVKQLYNIPRVSIERVVSGQGIGVIYQFLRDRSLANQEEEESPKLKEIWQTWQRERTQAVKTVDLAAEISKAALEDNDTLSQVTMKLFLEAYGAEAGNLALKMLPYGGLYIAGGIAAKNLALMQQKHFLAAFKDKKPMENLLENIPVHIVLNGKVGLIGAAKCALGEENYV
jgi:glucokinase